MLMRHQITQLNVSGLTIGGTAEKGVYTLLKKHKEKGIFHQDWLDGTNAINNQAS